MPERGDYTPSLSEIKAHAEEKRAEAAIRRGDEAKNKKTFKQAGAAVAAALAIFGASRHVAENNEVKMPDDRFTPERAATMPGEKSSAEQQREAVAGMQRREMLEAAEEYFDEKEEKEATAEKEKYEKILREE